MPLNAGILQGSCLGTLLFILYINDIQNYLESEVLFYADDTSLLSFGPNPTETAASLKRDLEKIALCAKIWKVSFNSDKSRDVNFSEKCFDITPPLLLNNGIFERVTVHKHLGLMLA